MNKPGIGKLAIGQLATAFVIQSTGCYVGLQTDNKDEFADGEPDTAGDTGDPDAAEDAGDSDDSDDQAKDPGEVVERIGANGLRRLSANEYSRTVGDLLGVDVDAEISLPEDERFPFDNISALQTESPALIDSVRSLAESIAAEVVASPELRADAIGCTPSGAADTDCFRSFVEGFGRRALRRPLRSAEADRFVGLMSEAEETGDFYAAVEVALSAFLQHPRFLYRIEIGTPVDDHAGVFRLDSYEIATRLSYMLVGSTPSETLLDLAEAGDLDSPDDVAAAAEEILLAPQALDQLTRFHAMWLDYERLSHEPALRDPMQAETKALIERVVFEENRPWAELLLAEETFVDARLAEHYGIPAPAVPSWVNYGDSERAGLFSHGTFLSASPGPQDTNPTKRGLLIQERLLCTAFAIPEDVPPAPEPEPGKCKVEHLQEGHLNPGCAACHDQFDPIGFGLERYDLAGAFRNTEFGNADCSLDGEGFLLNGADKVAFSGPGELGRLLAEDPRVDRCVAQHLYQFATGRQGEELDEFDRALILDLTGDMAAGELNLTEFILGYVSDEAFMYRRELSESDA